MNTITATERKVSVPDGHLVADVARAGPPVVLLHAGGMQRVMLEDPDGFRRAVKSLLSRVEGW